MSVDITSLQIKVVSDGIKEASNSLSGLSTSAANSERRVTAFIAAMEKLNAISRTSSQGADSFMGKMREQANALNSLNANARSAAGGTNALASAMGPTKKTIDDTRVASDKFIETLKQKTATLGMTTKQIKDYNIAQLEAKAANLGVSSSAAPMIQALRDANNSISSTARSQRIHNESMKEGHALARGLSGSLGALWVTYGNLAGMAVGLAIGASLKGIVTIGKDVEHTLDAIRVRGEETTESISKLRQAVYDLGQGVYGPKEVAEAFHTLILAGLNAKQALSSIKDTLNLATVGGVDIAAAANTLVSVGTAMGYTSNQYGIVADVIAKTAAVSKSSVEGLSESFKQASSVSQLYKLSIVDIGTSLAALSQLGIERTSAGTALKNFYADLTKNSEKSKKALDDMGLSLDKLRDKEGKMNDIATIFQKMSDGLLKYQGGTQADILKNIFGERGIKLAAEGIRLIREEAEKGSSSFVKLGSKITDSYGFAAIGAAQLALTTKNQMESVKNTIQVSFAEAFDKVGPEVSVFTNKMKEAFSSEGFKTGIQTVAKEFANMATWIGNNIGLLVDLAKVFITLKAAMMVAEVVMGVTVALRSFTLVLEGAAIASKAFQLSLGAVGFVLTAAATLWEFYGKKRDDTTTGVKTQAALQYLGDYSKALENEAKRLQKQIDLIKTGTTAREASAEAIRQENLEMARQQAITGKADAAKALDKAKAGKSQYEINKASELALSGRRTGFYNIDSLADSFVAFNKTIYDVNFNLANVEKHTASVQTLGKELRKVTKETEKLGGSGTGTLPPKVKAKSQGLLNVNEAIAENALVYQENVQALEREITLDKLRKKYKMESAQDIYLSIKDAELKRIQFMQDAMDKDLKAAELYNVKDENLTIAAKTKKLSITRKYTGLIADANTAIEKARIESIYASQEPFRELEKAREKELNDINKNIEAISAQVKAYDSLPEAMKRAGVTEKQLQDNITQVKIDNLYKEREAIVANGDITDAYDQRALENINTMIAKQIEYRDLQFSKEMQQAQQKAIAEYNEAWKRSNKQYSDDLANAIIEGGGKGWKKMLNDMKLGFAKTLLQPILAPISGALATGTAQAQATIANMAGGNASASNSSLGALSTAYNMYKAISSGFNNVGSTVSNSIISAGNALGFGDTAGLNGYDVVDNPLTNVAGTAGTVASYASGAIAGKKLGSAISDGYQVGNHGSAIVNVSTVIGSVLGGPIGGAIGGTVGGLINRAFGMSAKEVTSQGIRGSLSSEAVTGESFSNWHQSGGWFRSDKNGTDITQLSASTLNTLKQGFVSLQNTSINFAESLALSGDTIKGFSKDFNITLTNDSENNQKAISEFFVQLGDELATKLVPNIAEFALINESASTTLQRLSTVFKATDTVATILGRKVEDVFGGIGLASDKARERLVNLFGGLDSLGSSMTFYAQNFLTTAEKIAPLQQSLSASLNDLNLGWVKTIDQFKSVLAGLDLTNEAQAQQFYSLMKLAPAFKEVADYTDALATNAITLTSAQQRLKDSASADFAVVSKAITKAKEVSKAEFDAQTAIINAKKSSAETVFNDTKKAITDTLNTAKTANQAIAELSSSLSRTLDSMTLLGTEAESRTNAQGIILAALETAKSTGVLPTSDSLSKSLSIVAQSSTDLFSTYEEYAKDFQLTKNAISDLNGLTGARKTSSDLQLAALENSLTLLQSNYDLQLTQFTEEQAAAQAKYDGEIAKYDSILSIAQQQLDIMNGSYVAIKELSSAMIAFAESSRAAITAIQPSTTVPTTNTSVPYTKPATKSEIEGLYQTILGRAPDQEGLDWWVNNVAQNGFSLATVAGDFYKSTEYQTMHGSHADGLDMVPFDNYRANLHAGERVLTAKAARDADSTAEEIRAMRMEINAALLSVAQNTGVSSKLMRQWDGDGIPPERIGT